MSVFYDRLINQIKFNCRTVFSSGFDKQDENSQVFDETDLYFNLNNNHKITETHIDNTDAKSPLEHQDQQQEVKDSG